MKVLVAAVSATLLGLTLPAGAAHPSERCLDVEPDLSYPVSNDDIVDSLRAYVGATDAGHPPQEEGCVIGGGSGSGAEVDFEIEGADDPDASFSPETPDLACTIVEDGDLCTVDPPPPNSGEQTIWAWIDLDHDDATSELDSGEQRWDEDTDATDVVLWNWGYYDPCRTTASCGAPNLTIRYDRQDHSFKGSVGHEMKRCQIGRLVRLRRVRRGHDPVIGSDRSNWRSNWRVSGFRNLQGNFYAVAPRTSRCRGDVSHTINI